MLSLALAFGNYSAPATQSLGQNVREAQNEYAPARRVFGSSHNFSIKTQPCFIRDKNESEGNDTAGLRAAGEVDAPISRDDLGVWRDQHDRILQKYTPEYIAKLELSSSGIDGPWRKWENNDAEVHRDVAQSLRDNFNRYGPQDFRKVYGRGIGAALAARTARSVGASYRRADQRSGGNGASVVWEPDDTPDIS